MKLVAVITILFMPFLFGCAANEFVKSENGFKAKNEYTSKVYLHRKMCDEKNARVKKRNGKYYLYVDVNLKLENSEAMVLVSKNKITDICYLYGFKTIAFVVRRKSNKTNPPFNDFVYAGKLFTADKLEQKAKIDGTITEVVTNKDATLVQYKLENGEVFYAF